MTDTVTPEQAGGEKKERRSSLWWLLLLLLLIAAGVAYYFFVIRQAGPDPDGSFRTEVFEGCDSAGNCGKFIVYAPGFDYAWQYDKAIAAARRPGRPPLASKISDDLKAAQGVVVAGLASQEGGEDFNRWLAACRAREFEGLVADVQASAGGSATIYRASLGRYRGEIPLSSADVLGPSAGQRTQVQRLMVLAYIIEAEPNIDLAEALRDGIERHVGPALADQLPEVAQQLDFENYSCWGEAFELTTIGGRMGASCYPEPASCSVFTQ